MTTIPLRITNYGLMARDCDERRARMKKLSKQLRKGDIGLPLLSGLTVGLSLLTFIPQFSSFANAWWSLLPILILANFVGYAEKELVTARELKMLALIDCLDRDES